MISSTAADADLISYEIAYGHPRDSYIIYDEKVYDSTGLVLFDRGDLDRYPMGGTLRYLAEDRSIFAAIRQAQLAGEYEESSSLMTQVARDVSRISKYRLDPSNLARPSRLPDTPVEDVSSRDVLSPRLSYRGEDLPTVLYYLAETRSPRFELINLRCGEIVEGFDGFEFNAVGTDRIGFSVKFSDSRGIVPAANLSDGTLICVGLVSLLVSQESSPVICIEEPENGLTPPATRAIYRAMQDFVGGSLTGAPGQLLISSHSPYVICEAWNGPNRDFIYQMRPNEGRALVRRFADIIDHHQIQLEKDAAGNRTLLNLRNAELVMDGYLSD